MAALAGLEGVEIDHEKEKRDPQGLIRLSRSSPQVEELHRHTRIGCSVVSSLSTGKGVDD